MTVLDSYSRLEETFQAFYDAMIEDGWRQRTDLAGRPWWIHDRTLRQVKERDAYKHYLDSGYKTPPPF